MSLSEEERKLMVLENTCSVLGFVKCFQSLNKGFQHLQNNLLVSPFYNGGRGGEVGGTEVN